MAIDIGAGAANYENDLSSGYTLIDLTNPANESGALDIIEIWTATNGTGVKVGTFYGSGTSYTNRDYETLGSVASGSKHTFTGLSCSVQTGDFLGVYLGSGTAESSNSGGSGFYYKSGDQFGAGSQTYGAGGSATRIAIYGTGETSTALPVFDYHYNNMRP